MLGWCASERGLACRDLSFPMSHSCWDVCTTTARAAALPGLWASGPVWLWCGASVPQVIPSPERQFICKMKELEPTIPEFFQTCTDYIILIPKQHGASQLPSSIYRCRGGAHSLDCWSSASNFDAGGNIPMMQEIILHLCCVTALWGCPPTRKYGNLESGSAGLFSGMPVCLRQGNAFRGWKWMLTPVLCRVSATGSAVLPYASPRMQRLSLRPALLSSPFMTWEWPWAGPLPRALRTGVASCNCLIPAVWSVGIPSWLRACSVFLLLLLLL